MIRFKPLIGRMVSSVFALLLALLIYALIAPSIQSSDVGVRQGIELSSINPKIAWAVIIFIPVIFCTQAKLKWLKLIG